MSILREINRRAVYRWRQAVKRDPKPHGGGGGLNKLQSKEERAVVRMARAEPQWRCRRLAYELERRGKAYVGKTKAAELVDDFVKHGILQETTGGQRNRIFRFSPYLSLFE